jgi:hypothetical protein
LLDLINYTQLPEALLKFCFQKLVLGFSLAGLAFALIGAPIWQFFSAGFSFNVWVLLEFTLIVAALILVLVGNWREKPYLYLPVLVFMVIF